MAKRDTHKYHFWHKNKIVWCGITKDLDLQEQILIKRFGGGHISEIGRKNTTEYALEWERHMNERGFPNRRKKWKKK